MTYDELLKWASERGWFLLVEEWEGHYWLAVITGQPETIVRIDGVPLSAHRCSTIEEAVQHIEAKLEETK